MIAKVAVGFVKVEQVQTLGGVTALVVKCDGDNYVDWLDSYMAAPKVVEFEGERFGKSGWDSDTGAIFYRTDVMLARVVA
jgi:hypothetical protein